MPLIRLATLLALWSLTTASIQAQPTERFGSGRPATPAPAVRPGPSFSEQLLQVERRPATNVKTVVEVTVLLPRLGAAVEAQRWAKTFSDLGVQAQFRNAIGTDELGVEESVRGTFRTVKVVGELTNDGRLQLGEQLYTHDDLRRLREWIESLQTYGAQGSPQGQPLWGLNERQFTELYEALSTAVTVELEGQPLNEALTQLPLPPQHALRRLAAADEWLAAHPAGVIENRVQGLSCGTVLALILSESNLGFAPARTPNGQLELHIAPRQSGQQVWPVGWNLPEGVDHGQLVPVLHKFLEIGFDKAALQDVLDAAAAAIEVPILVDYHATRGAGVDLEQKAVSYPAKRTTWSLMLNTVIRKANLIKEVRVDERGQPFLWIAPFVPTPVQR